jgi:high-affinity Fe2+/Pb2+ permease
LLICSPSLIALQAGGSSHPWVSAYVLVNLFIGFFLLVGFFVWEWKFARYPIIPKELFRGQNIVAMCFVVSFVSGKSTHLFLSATIRHTL